MKIDVEDDGRVNVASSDDASASKALSIIEELTATPELNKSYLGKVQRITDFGAFVEVLPGVDGLLHVSEIAHYRVKEVRDELREGEEVFVKVINVDPSGKNPAQPKGAARQARGRRPGRGWRAARTATREIVGKRSRSQKSGDRKPRRPSPGAVSTTADPSVAPCDAPSSCGKTNEADCTGSQVPWPAARRATASRR